MFSLKAYVPSLAQYLNLTPDSLYERQRALIRSGLLVAIEGRGPGSGVKVSVHAVALLIMSVMATDSLAEIGSVVRRLGSARAEKKTCPLTGSFEFAQALENILESTARRINWIKVSRPAQKVEIGYDFTTKRKVKQSFFGEAPDRLDFQMKIEAELPGFAVWCIADDLSDIANGKSPAFIEQRVVQMRSDFYERYDRFSSEARRKS